jgi:hypothetical protein
LKEDRRIYDPLPDVATARADLASVSHLRGSLTALLCGEQTFDCDLDPAIMVKVAAGEQSECRITAA